MHLMGRALISPETEEGKAEARRTCCSIVVSFLSDRLSVWPEMEKYTPSILAKSLVTSAEPAQECSTSPAGNGPAWHSQITLLPWLQISDRHNTMDPKL